MKNSEIIPKNSKNNSENFRNFPKYSNSEISESERKNEIPKFRNRNFFSVPKISKFFPKEWFPICYDRNTPLFKIVNTIPLTTSTNHLLRAEILKDTMRGIKCYRTMERLSKLTNRQEIKRKIRNVIDVR